MKKLAVLVLFGAMAALPACGGASYTSDYDPSANFSDFETYQWAERPAQGRDDPRVYNAITAGRVKTAVDKTLAAKGFQEVTSNSPDFWVAWHGAIEGKMSMTTMNSGYGGWYDYGWYGGGTGISTTHVNEWDEGTLVLDIIDNDNRELVWRGTVTDVVDQGNRSPEKAQQDFDAGAEKLLASFPPGG